MVNSSLRNTRPISEPPTNKNLSNLKPMIRNDKLPLYDSIEKTNNKQKLGKMFQSGNLDIKHISRKNKEKSSENNSPKRLSKRQFSDIKDYSKKQNEIYGSNKNSGIPHFDSFKEETRTTRLESLNSQSDNNLRKKSTYYIQDSVIDSKRNSTEKKISINENLSKVKMPNLTNRKTVFDAKDRTNTLNSESKFYKNVQNNKNPMH